jgi:SNF2 family DNA or RNA helicase
MAVDRARDEEEAIRSGSHFTAVDIASEVNIPLWCPILVVAPVAVAEKWAKELLAWGRFAVERVCNPSALGRIRNGESEILILKDSLLKSEEGIGRLVTVHWKLIIVDEIHKLKRTTAKGSKHLRMLRRSGDGDVVIIGLTGTLMQNSHAELWNLIDLVHPNLLGTKSAFNSRYGNPIKQAE